MPPWVPLALGALALVAFTRYAAASSTREELAHRWGIYFGVRPELLLRMIKHESGNNPQALRNVGGDARRGGAWGYMQMTLATAEGLVQRLSRENHSYPPVAANLNKFRELGAPALFDPDLNIMLGAAYMSELLAEFGDEAAAVGAYNRGEAGMRNLLSQGVDPMELKYVQRVYA